MTGETPKYIDIVFDGPPSHEAGRFVEVEDSSGKSITIGEWVHRPDGYWALRITDPRELLAMKGERDRAMKVLDPSMPESGLEDAARQVKQAAISWKGNFETIEKQLSAALEREKVKDAALRAFIAAEDSWRATMTGTPFDDPLTDAYEKAKAALPEQP